MPRDANPRSREMTRRSVLGTTLSVGALAAGAAAFAQQPVSPQAPREKGPRVWLDMDQKELDDAYDQAVYAPNLQQVINRFASNSEQTRRRLGQPDRVAYGTAEIERLDIFKTKRSNAPTFIFVHGGAWRAEVARNSAFPAEMFVAAGAHYVVPDFSWVQDTQGSLLPMADQVRRAIVWVYRNAAMFGGDPGRIYLGGHSSGAHLAGVALTTDWQHEFGIPGDVIKGGLCISGMYDLKPVRLSARSSYVKFTDEMEDALSAQRHLDQLHVPLVLAYGTNETPEFQRQSRDFAAAVKAAGKPVQLLVGENYNHFEMRETLANPFGLAGRAALEQMKLSLG
jgi:arylformamidase